jgi:hypothetical protein
MPCPVHAPVPLRSLFCTVNPQPVYRLLNRCHCRPLEALSEEVAETPAPGNAVGVPSNQQQILEVMRRSDPAIRSIKPGLLGSLTTSSWERKQRLPGFRIIQGSSLMTMVPSSAPLEKKSRGLHDPDHVKLFPLQNGVPLPREAVNQRAMCDCAQTQ